MDAPARQAAVVMELTHLATLYHDDVMDEAPVRRGAPAAHRLWGNSAAILAGDLIFARASQLMAELGPRPVQIQADTFERLVQGQLWETRGPAEGADPIEHYYAVLSGKTGSLIAAIERLRGPGKTLKPYETPDLSSVEQWLAENEALDPEGPEEMFEPFSRRGLFRRLRKPPG